MEPDIPGQADDIANIPALAPRQHLVPAEAAVGAQDDPYLRPDLPQPLDQQGQDRPGMLGAVDVRGPQIADQQLIAAEHIERQKAVMIIIAKEEAAFLAPMHRIIGGIKVQDQLCGRGVKGSDDALHHGLMGGPGPRAVGGLVKTANGRGRGQPAIPPAGSLEGQIIAQGVMIVGIFIAERHRKHPLAQQRQ